MPSKLSRSPANEAAKRRTLYLILGILAGMSLFAWALVPLYRLACTTLGIGPVPQKPDPAIRPTAVGSRAVTVRLLGLSNVGTNATIEPLESQVRVRVGEVREVRYRFKNLTDSPLDFQAVHSVTPMQADAQLHKLECFCFSRQSLLPRETKILPLSFWVDPKLDSRTTHVSLQYTLFALNPDRSALPKAAGLHP